MDRPSRHRWRLILIPFSWLYGGVIRVRNFLFDQGLLRAAGFRIPIISVGNITVGGTGKTPHVEYLVDLLKKEFRVATLSRGYRRKTRGFRVASPGSSVHQIGDEPMQIQKNFPDVTVAVDHNRVNGVRELMKLAPPLEVVVLDDAYQHRSIQPGLSILLIDYQRPIQKDHLLPAGLLREPAVNRNRANLILVTRSPETLRPIEMREYVNRLGLQAGQHLFFTTLRYDEPVPVFGDVPLKGMEWFRTNAGGVFIISGIANPHALRTYAQSIHPRFSEMVFPDHHAYSHPDMDRIKGRYAALKKEWGEVLVLTTQKDAVKIREFELDNPLRSDIHAVRINVHFLNNDKQNFDKIITKYVTGNKRSSILHKETD
jgi:tetraacyldisaccharide 4'-kinase